MAFHSSLTVEQSVKLEQILKTCLKVILGDMYVSYSSALEMTGLKPLSELRQQRCLDFARKCLKHPRNSKLFPLKKTEAKDLHNLRNQEIFEVNFSGGGKYKNSAIPFCQRLLNEFYMKNK